MLHWSELVNTARMYLNRPLPVDDAAFWRLYEPLPLLPARCSLLCVVTTYRRPEACQDLLARLQEALAREDACVLVLNDHSDRDYSEVRRQAEAWLGPRLIWLDARERLGKPGFWKAYQVAFLIARRLQPQQALFLQDDLQFNLELLNNARGTWTLLHDPRQRVLYLFSSSDDERFGRWIVYPRGPHKHFARKTQWFDLQAFLVDRAFFELLDYTMLPIHNNRWRRAPTISSGVGKQLTSRLFGRANIYQSYPPLVSHGELTSEMNPEARAKRALDSRRP